MKANHLTFDAGSKGWWDFLSIKQFQNKTVYQLSIQNAKYVSLNTVPN